MNIRPLLIFFFLSFCFALRAQTPSSITSPAPSRATAPDISASSLQYLDPAKVAEIRKMLNLTGSLKLMNLLNKQMLDQMIAAVRSRNKQLPDEFWINFEKEIDTDVLANKMIAIYAKVLFAG